MTKGISFASAFVLALALGVPTVAHAQERKSPLADAPAIRKRVELRDKRFEIGVGAGTTLGQDFYNAVLVNARLGFHLTDWLAIAGWGGLNVTPKMKTAFHEKLESALPESMSGDRTPTRDEALNGMNRIGEVFALQAELVPFTGKIGLFSSLFMNYDFYAFGGPGFVDLKADSTECPDSPQRSCAVTGMKIGANFGVGTHLYTNDLFALNFEVRDVFIKNNPAGRDKNGDTFANERDQSWGSNYIVSLNLMFFLPATASISP